jgi:hypothetical protein
MSLTILYSDPHHPREPGVTMIVAQARAAAMMDHLEHRGFLINKITVRCLPKNGKPIWLDRESCPGLRQKGFFICRARSLRKRISGGINGAAEIGNGRFSFHQPNRSVIWRLNGRLGAIALKKSASGFL